MYVGNVQRQWDGKQDEGWVSKTSWAKSQIGGWGFVGGTETVGVLLNTRFLGENKRGAEA